MADVLDAGPFFHGTRALLAPGELLSAGHRSNYRPEVVMNHVYFTALVAGAGLAAEIAAWEGTPHVYEVVPTGAFENDPNVTDKRFPGNPTRSYRTTQPLRVVEEIHDVELPDPELIARMRASTAELRELGIEAMD